jgi:hypothetical protein
MRAQSIMGIIIIDDADLLLYHDHPLEQHSFTIVTTTTTTTVCTSNYYSTHHRQSKCCGSYSTNNPILPADSLGSLGGNATVFAQPSLRR